MNDEVFQRAKEERLLLKILKNRHHSWIGQTTTHKEFVVNILEGEIFGKKSVGRPRLQYLSKSPETQELTVYSNEIMVCNKSRWKAAKQ